MLGHALDEVASLVDFASAGSAYDGRSLPDRLRQRRRSVDDEEASDARIEAVADKNIEERPHRRGILGRVFKNGQRVLVALVVDPHGGHERQLLTDAPAVDLDRKQVGLLQIGRHPFGHPRRRQFDEPCDTADFDSSGALRRRIDLLNCHFGSRRSKQWFDSETFLRIGIECGTGTLCGSLLCT